MTVQARTSYVETEVLWGHRFYPVLMLEHDHYSVNYEDFHNSFEVTTPIISAKEMEEEEDKNAK